MSYCINPKCKQRQNPDESERCLNCGTELLIDQRFRLIKPLRPLDFRYSTEIFEVVDDKGIHKVMKVLKSQEEKEIELLERETLTLQLFNYPGIPRVIDDVITVISEKNYRTLHCLVMQKFEGQNLEDWLKANGRISQTLALDWLTQLIKILDKVHRSGFFHRDIKPSNIILQPDGQLGLIDFGAVREVSRTYLLKLSGSGGNEMGLGNHEITTIVTPGFSPLEQINGQALPQSDFYALGRTLVYLITGINVINLPTDPKTTRLIWRNKARQIERAFADLLEQLMAPAPGNRPISTQFILQRLEQLPNRLKLDRVLKTNLFKSLEMGLLIVIIVAIFQGGSQALSSYFFYKATRQDEPKIAKKYYELAADYNPKDEKIYNNLAVACQQIQDLNCASKNYEKALNLRPLGWEAHYNLGSFYDEQDQYALAEDQYKLAIKYSNNQAMNAVNNLSRLKNKQEKYSEAATLALEGLKYTSYPQWQAGLYKNLGWARFQQQSYTKAKEYLLHSVNLDSQRVDAYCLLAKTEEALGDLKYAQAHWEICLMENSVNSSLPEVQAWRQEILQRLFK
ncbi:MAG: 4-Cys prefix domain-containing protein [Nostoc sp.]|uniref:protein kinase domain-containing protein n=1 Tax=Nostoc sp. TaxID=1180 RepID=UPI002FFC315E